MNRSLRLIRKSLVGLLLLGIFVTGFAQKPYNGSKTLEIDNLQKEQQLKTTTGKIGKTTHIERYVYDENYGPLSGTPEQMARTYLRGNANRFGLEDSRVQLNVIRVRQSPGGYHVRFRPALNNIPIYDADIVVTLNKENVVTFVANDFRPGLEVEDQQVNVTESDAISAAKSYLNATGKDIVAPSARLMIFESKDRGAVLAYRTIIVTQQPMGDWEVFVDAATGSIIHVKDQMRYQRKTDGSGLTFDPDPLTTAGVEYGAPYVDDNDNDIPELNAERDTVVLQDLDYNGSVYSLSGPYCVLADLETPNDQFPTLSDPNGFNYTRSPQEFEDVLVYYHIDKSYRWLDSLGFSVPGLLAFQSDPHGLDGADNSHYSPSGNYCAWGEGGVDDAEDADVVWHEYGHAIQENITGGMSYTGETMSLQEGSSDYWAVSYSRALYEYGWFRVFNWDGHNPFWPGRLANLDWHYPEDYVPGHNGGQLWSSALMKIWEELGRELTDELFIQAHYIWGSSPGLEDAAAAFVQADQMLYNGAHLTPIIYWFDDRGLVDASDYIPQITHTPLNDSENINGPYPVNAVIIPGTAPLDTSQLFVIYEYAATGSGRMFADSVALVSTGGTNEYAADIPGPGYATHVHYYISVVDSASNLVTHPTGAPQNYHSFYAGPDTVAPVITHTPLRDQAYIRWPATVRAQVTDNIGLDTVVVNYYVNTPGTAGTFALTAQGNDMYSGVFNIDTTAVSVGDSIFYRITATDVSSNGNIANDPVSGFHKFHIIDTRGLVLIINDDPSGNTRVSDSKGTYLRSPENFGASANTMQQWLNQLGFVADVVDVPTSLTTNWEDYSIVINASGENTSPVEDPAYRTKWESYVADAAHKYIIEGGEVGYDAASTPGYPNFATNVLHSDDWDGDNSGNMNLRSGYHNHPMVIYPHILPTSFSLNYQGYGDQDSQQNLPEAYVIYGTSDEPDNAGILVYDDNPNPQSAQMAYYAFNLAALTDTMAAMHLLENTVEFLLTPEAPAIGAITGNVDLTDTANDSGARVILSGISQDTIVTGTSGDFSFAGLYNGNYSITASKPGYYPYTVTIDNITVNSDTVSGINFTLDPIQIATITGTVTLSDTGNYAGVVVQVLQQSGALDTTDASGQYNIAGVLPGEVTVKAFKFGYKTVKTDTTIPNDGSTITLNFNLVPGINEYYFDFEADNGSFTGTSSWQWGVPTSGPGSAYQGTKLWATNLNGEYGNSEHAELNTAELDLAGFISPKLTFANWYDIEESSTTPGKAWDGGNLKISTDGGSSFTLVYPLGGYPDSIYTTTPNPLAGQPVYSGLSAGWELAEFDLSTYGGESVILKFDFGSDGSITKDGWYVDSVMVIEQSVSPTPPTNLTVLDNQNRVMLGWDAVIQKLLKTKMAFNKDQQFEKVLATLQKEKEIIEPEKQPEELSKQYSYRVYKSEDGNTFTVTGSTQSTSYTDSSVIAGNTYYYYVTTVLGNLESSPSDTVNVLVESATVMELWYDDGSPSSGYYWNQAGAGSGNRMSPPGVVKILKARFYLMQPDSGNNTFTARIFNFDGGQPGAELGSVQVSDAPNNSWVEADFSSQNITTDHDFLVFMEYDGANRPVFGFDPVDNGRAWDYTPAAGWSAWNETYFMRAVVTTLTGLEKELGGRVPATFAVKQNYPNPFNPATTIKYQLPRNSDVTLEIYNILGQKVRTLVEEKKEAGYHQVIWNGRNDVGAQVASGIYIYRFRAGDYKKVMKLMLMK